MSQTPETDTKKRREVGSIVEKNGRLYARIKYTKPDGKSAAVWRAATNRTHAKQLINDLKRELEERGTDSICTAQKNFAELADYYQKTYAQPPVYVDGRKAAEDVREKIAAIRPSLRDEVKEPRVLRVDPASRAI